MKRNIAYMNIIVNFYVGTYRYNVNPAVQLDKDCSF